MLFLMWNTGSTMQSIKDYQPTPERIKSHQDHEAKRKLFCKVLEEKYRDKWKELRPNKSTKKK
jgi:hypothetical protein